METKDILKDLRKKRGLSMQDFCAKADISFSTYQNYETGKRIPTADILIKLSKFYKVSTDYLLGLNISQSSDTLDGFAERFDMSALEKKIIEGYVKLPKEMRTDLMEFLHRSVSEAMEESGSVNRAEFISVSFADYPVSAGIGDELSDYENWDKALVPLTDKSRKASFIIRVDGDSMEPEYHNNDYILVKKQDAVEVGEIGVFFVDGKGYMKKFGADRLISLNEEYKDIPLTENTEFRCFGLVLGKAEIVK